MISSSIVRSIVKSVVVLVLACFFSLPVFSQNSEVKTEQPLRYGDPGYQGKNITLTCRSCGLPTAVFGIAAKAGVKVKFDNAQGWNRVIVSVNAENRPWNVVLEDVLSENRLEAVWSNDVLAIVSRSSGPRIEKSFVAELLKDIPPIPENVLNLPTPSRAKEAERFFKEGINYLVLAGDPDVRKALSRFAWAFQLFGELNYAGRQATTLYFIGRSLVDLHRFEEAARMYEEGLSLVRTAENPRCELALESAVELTRTEVHGKTETALAKADSLYRTVREIAVRNTLVSRTSLDLRLDGDLSTNLGWLYYRLGENAKAITLLQKAVVQQRVAEDGEIGAIESLAVLQKASLQAGDKATEQKSRDQIRDVLKEANSPRAQAVFRLFLAKTYFRLDDPTAALQWSREAAGFLQAAQDAGIEISHYRLLGRIHLALKQSAEARKALEKALALSKTENEADQVLLITEDLKQLSK